MFRSNTDLLIFPGVDSNGGLYSTRYDGGHPAIELYRGLQRDTRRVLTRLNKIFGRVETIETPVQGEEVYAVIRRRLFEVEGLKTGAMREAIHNYFQLYQQYRDDLPPKARDASYRGKMELAYPFHPDVIDILYEKWSTFPTFQRTRGALRLLANVIEDLYQREVSIDLILPGDLNLAKPSIRQELLKHIGPEYEGVIGADIAGHEAKSMSSILLTNPGSIWHSVFLPQSFSTPSALAILPMNQLALYQIGCIA